MSEEQHEELNLTPPKEGFELYRHKNAEERKMQGWSRLYWARKNETGDYEVRAVTKEGQGYSYPGGTFSKEAFERLYEKADDVQPQPASQGGQEVFTPPRTLRTNEQSSSSVS